LILHGEQAAVVRGSTAAGSRALAAQPLTSAAHIERRSNLSLKTAREPIPHLDVKAVHQAPGFLNSLAIIIAGDDGRDAVDLVVPRQIVNSIIRRTGPPNWQNSEIPLGHGTSVPRPSWESRLTEAVGAAGGAPKAIGDATEHQKERY